MVIGQGAADVVPFLSVAVMEKVALVADVPVSAAVGVPETAPVDVFRVSPGGSVFTGTEFGSNTEKV